MLNGTYAKFTWLETRAGPMCTKNVQAGLLRALLEEGVKKE